MLTTQEGELMTSTMIIGGPNKVQKISELINRLLTHCR